MNISWSDIKAFAANSFTAILKGEFLLRLKVVQYFMHIIFTFFLFALAILISILTETSMAKVETNKQTLKELEIVNSQKVYELARASRRTVVLSSLEALGSDLKEPEQPARVIK